MNMLSNARVRVFLAIGIFNFCTLAFAGQYSIRVAELPPPQAESLEAKLTGDGAGPVAAEAGEPMTTVYFGSFESYADSLWYLKILQSKGYADAKTVDISGKSLPLAGELKFPYGSFFDTSTMAESDQLSYDQRDPRIMPIYELLKTDLPAAKVELHKIVADETSGPLQGWAMLRLGFVKIKENNKDASFALFKAVADGAVPATRADRIDAANRAARLLIGKQQRVEALQALNQLYELQTDPHQKAATLTEIAGMKVELVRCAKGTWDEARAACQRVLQEAGHYGRYSRTNT